VFCETVDTDTKATYQTPQHMNLRLRTIMKRVTSKVLKII